MKQSILAVLLGFLPFYNLLMAGNSTDVEQIKKLISEAQSINKTDLDKSDSLLNIAFVKAQNSKNNLLLSEVYVQQIKNDITRQALKNAESKNNALEKLIKTLKKY